MKWETFGAIDKRLIADDGEILDRVTNNYQGSWIVDSTQKHYVSQESAMKAAEREHGPQGAPHDN